jgi:hypothetical protein
MLQLSGVVGLGVAWSDDTPENAGTHGMWRAPYMKAAKAGFVCLFVGWLEPKRWRRSTNQLS